MIETSNYFQPAYTSTTPSFVITGNEFRWHFTNLEPTSQDNVRLSVITPPIWRAILAARQQAQLKPDDAAVQIQLGEAYWAAIPIKNTWPQELSLAEHFGPLAEAAFKRAVELAPDSVSAQLAYARFLTYHAWSETPEPYYSRALQEVNHLLEMDPTNAEAKDLAAFLHDTIYTYFLNTPIPTDTFQRQSKPSNSVPTLLPSQTPPPVTPIARLITTAPTPVVSVNSTLSASLDSTKISVLLSLGGIVAVFIAALAYLRRKR